MQYKFLLNNLSESDQLQEELGTVGISDADVHFISERSEDFAGHSVHEASILEERDIIHSTVRGGFAGIIAGACISFLVHSFQPYGWDVQPINMFLIILLTTGFGGWMGGLYGISHRNYRLSNYEEELQNGKAIMLVYTDEEHASMAKKLIEEQHPETKYLGKDSNYDNPLKSAKTAELED